MCDRFLAQNTINKSELDRGCVTGSLDSMLGNNGTGPMGMSVFYQSSIDGYACRYKDLYNDLVLIDVDAVGTTLLKSMY